MDHASNPTDEPAKSGDDIRIRKFAVRDHRSRLVGAYYVKNSDPIWKISSAMTNASSVL